MSVLIRNMEMPTSCGYCPFENHTDDGYECRINGCLTEYQKRPPDCPLVPVPKHGDLIDRKAICLTDFEIVMCDGDYKEGMKMLLEKIESAPTIIPASKEGDG